MKNVLATDATLLFTVGNISGGTALTLRMAQQNHKPYLHINLESIPEEKAVLLIQEWLGREKPEILNVAGSRESKSPGIYSKVFGVFSTALKE